MQNHCEFSSCRRYRYVLIHRWDELFDGGKLIMWIGLNPSTADEQQLDPTLRRIARFSRDWGYDGFVMGNIFGYRATLPADMRTQEDPNGPDNDRWLLEMAGRCEKVVAAWGAHGAYRDRGSDVARLLGKVPLYCVNQTKEGHPIHPLYQPADRTLIRWQPKPPEDLGRVKTNGIPPLNKQRERVVVKSVKITRTVG